MALHLDGTCHQCAERKPLLVGGGPDALGGDVIALCVVCLGIGHSAARVLEMIEAGGMSAEVTRDARGPA